jgi:hypothetical protein
VHAKTLHKRTDPPRDGTRVPLPMVRLLDRSYGIHDIDFASNYGGRLAFRSLQIRGCQTLSESDACIRSVRVEVEAAPWTRNGRPEAGRARSNASVFRNELSTFGRDWLRTRASSRRDWRRAGARPESPRMIRRRIRAHRRLCTACGSNLRRGTRVSAPNVGRVRIDHRQTNEQLQRLRRLS